MNSIKRVGLSFSFFLIPVGDPNTKLSSKLEKALYIVHITCTILIIDKKSGVEIEMVRIATRKKLNIKFIISAKMGQHLLKQ